MRTIRFTLALATLLSPVASWAAVPYLVADIDPRFVSDGSHPRGFAAVGGHAVFVTSQGEKLWGTDGAVGDPVRLGSATFRVRSGPAAAGGRAYATGCDEQGCGLFGTDGTAAGTIRLVRFPFVQFAPMEAVRAEGLPRTLLTFNAGNGFVLWRTDGTGAGTRKVLLAARDPRGLVGFGGKVWFFADLPNAPGALFSTNGLAGGTKRIGPSIEGSSLTPVGSRIVYFAGRELWSSDGTPGGTLRLAALPETAGPLVAAASRAFFFTSDLSGSGRALWVTDGTPAGTRRLLAIDGDFRNGLVALGAKVAFIGSDSRGFELWSSDGTTGGTRLVKDICPGGCPGAGMLGISALGRVWFAGFTPERGVETWTSNLTPGGTRQLRDLCAGSCSSAPQFWQEGGGKVYFPAITSGGQIGLYASDGTPARTILLGVEPSTSDSLPAAPLADGKLVFTGKDSSHGAEPWVSDGTVAGTQRLADLEFGNWIGSNPGSFAAAGGHAYFFADDGVHGSELWSSGGTPEATELVFDLTPGTFSPSWDLLSDEAGGRLVLFLAQSGARSFELIGSDGTAAGSERLLPAGVRADGRRVRAGDRLFFVANDAAHGAELWATDGTVAGTIRLTDLVPPNPFRPEGADFPALLALGDRVVAAALSPLGGEELWISDGTPGGTQPLHQVLPFLEAPLEAAKSPIGSLGGRFWFVAAAPGEETATLWRTDLSAAGTAPVSVLDLSQVNAGGWALFPLNGRMLVFGPAVSLGTTLWASDGTAAGTRTIGPAPFGRFVPPIVFAGRLWFGEPNFGNLWSTDGTAAGTVQAVDAAGLPVQTIALAAVSGRLAIASRNRLYESDGTPAGTLAIDLPGQADRFSLEAIASGDRLYFSWDDLVHGPELWALRPE